ncbi:nitrogenase [Acididesulfobacillus acetoxydans]|uniref:Nitrogenase n=1 Tax=Acididesulfobacillus acetoxydans TaxID=1561005 RepID=A0A8S0WQ24_9FIRM|nr:nitrogenase component 1 [Acididesulfobacillus acetoxydans]CAA7602344.1 nitrogenase [Acididesulfobacillus acetoxydans]CEJ08421.1 Nitrogenase iron-molybdenum cofactor biosynthesis protein NifN [Acididesulfobacillus acetoxydans]
MSYEAQRHLECHPEYRPESHPRGERTERHYQGNPQKNSPSLGATLAFLGMNGMLALLHGSQGCSTFIRLQLSRHFKEPIPLNSTAMTEENLVFGGWEQLQKGITQAVEKFHPEIVGVMSSGLSETMGEDMAAALRTWRRDRPELAGVPVVTVSTPDYIGSMQEGYRLAVTALLASLRPKEPEKGTGTERVETESPASELVQLKLNEPTPEIRDQGCRKSEIRGQSKCTFRSEPGNQSECTLTSAFSRKTALVPDVILLPGCHLTPADVEELKETVSLFGLQPLVLPDLSTSLDGHLESEPSAVVQGGTTLSHLKRLPQAVAVFSFGLSLVQPGDYLRDTYGVPHYPIPSLTGLEATDRFLLALASFSGQPVPEPLLRQRSRLLDTMADYHDRLAGLRVALALESDLLYSLSLALAETGAEISLALAATPEGRKNFPATIPFRVGDLEDLEDLDNLGELAHPATPGKSFNLIIANSNGRQAAKILQCPHLRAGLPVFDRAGYPQKLWTGYRGSQNFLFDVLNTMSG